MNHPILLCVGCMFVLWIAILQSKVPHVCFLGTKTNEPQPPPPKKMRPKICNMFTN